MNVEKYLNEAHELWSSFDPVLQRRFDEFLKTGVHNFDWIDRKYIVPNDDTDFYPELLNYYEIYGLLEGVTEDGLIVTTILRSIEMYLASALLRLQLPDSRIFYYMKKFKERYSRNSLCYVLKFYCSLVFKDLSVNVYFTHDEVRIKSQYEFDVLFQYHPVHFKQPFLCVSLNNILTFMFDTDFYNTLERKYYLNDAEWDIIAEIRDNDFQKDSVTVKLNKGKIDMINVIGREDDLDRLKELSDKYPHSNIGFQQYSGKKHHITIETRKKY